MRVILDECVPRKLRKEIAGHNVTTVPQAGYSGLTNGRLLKRLEGSFDVLITMDGSLPAQQNIKAFAFGVIVLCAPSNRISDLKLLAPDIAAALAAIAPGQLIRIPAASP